MEKGAIENEDAEECLAKWKIFRRQFPTSARRTYIGYEDSSSKQGYQKRWHQEK